ncbi:MAG TPA: hypothetical protein VLA43_16780, partial [Longimicrobiales bacterium]|nr:hypothetical protein [Longimicrobiales bacterium]
MLAKFLAGPGPGLLVLSGFPRVGKTRLLREATRGRPALWLRGSGLPAPLLARDMEVALGEQLSEMSVPGAPVPDAQTEATGPGADSPWRGIFAALHHLSRLPHPPVVVLDAADPLLRDRRFMREMEVFATALRTHARQLHLLLGATDPGPLEALGLPGWRGSGTMLGLDAFHLPLPPLSLRDVAATAAGWSPEEVVTLYGLVGGLPDFWSRVDPSVRPATNLARLLLAPDAPLRGLPEMLVPEGSPRSERALALVRALARGAGTWGDLRREARVFRSSSELGPYVKALVDAGVMDVSSSLDAGPRTRNRRYALTHPLLGFWHRSVHPRLGELDGGESPTRVLADRMGPEIPRLVSAALPGMVREYLRHHGNERLPSVAREAGGVWGDGYDLEVAGTLASGPAFYGHVRWDGPPPPPDALDTQGK